MLERKLSPKCRIIIRIRTNKNRKCLPFFFTVRFGNFCYSRKILFHIEFIDDHNIFSRKPDIKATKKGIIIDFFARIPCWNTFNIGNFYDLIRNTRKNLQ